MPPIKIVEDHHQALLAWAQYRSTLAQAPRLLTLDHHTDTSRPFRNFLKKQTLPHPIQVEKELLLQVDFRELSTVEAAIEKLDHDEHIVTALETDILSSAFVVAQNARTTGVDIYKKHRIMCQSVYPGFLSATERRFYCDQVLESDFLKEKIKAFNLLLQSVSESELLSTPYILDIDLDYLNTLRAAKPKDASYLKRLVDCAGLVTIATESDHVKMCALDSELTFEYLLENLLKILES